VKQQDYLRLSELLSQIPKDLVPVVDEIIHLTLIAVTGIDNRGEVKEEALKG